MKQLFLTSILASALAATGCTTAQLTFTKPLSPEVTAEVHGWVASTLKDPEGARFKPGTYAVVNQNDVLQWYCGMVNGKNSYGGYTGYQAFLAQGPGRAWLEQSSAGLVKFSGCSADGGQWPGPEKALSIYTAYKAGDANYLNAGQ